MIYVYKFEFPNGKNYIGITNNLSARFYCHKQARPNTLVGRAINKHGWPEASVLCVCEDYEYAFEIEKGLIKALNTKTPKGYNVTDGGKGSSGYVYTEQDKKKISEKLTKRLPVQKVILLYEEGKSIFNIAKIYNVSNGPVNRTLKEAGIKIRPPESYVKLNLPEQDICEKFQDGRSCKELSGDYGVSDGTIRLILKRNNIPRPNERVHLCKDTIYSMHDSGESMRSIARHFGVDKSAIKLRLEKRYT